MFLIQLSSNDGIESEDFPHEFWIDGDDDVFAAPESFTADEWQKISDESHSVSWAGFGVVKMHFFPITMIVKAWKSNGSATIDESLITKKIYRSLISFNEIPRRLPAEVAP